MAKYILADSANHTRRGSRIFPGHSTFSSQTPDNIVAQNASEIGTSPLVAIMLNPWHAQLEKPKMLELHFASIAIDTSDPTIRMNVREVEVPETTTDQKIIFALMVVSEVYRNDQFNLWAEKWINGSDRSAESAGKFIGYLGKYAKESRGVTDSLLALGVRSSELDGFGDENSDFCVRASEAVFAAQMYVDRTDGWPLLASRSVSSAVTGLGARTDLAAIAKKAIDAAGRSVMRTRTAA
jgi:hypothetical protein